MRLGRRASFFPKTIAGPRGVKQSELMQMTRCRHVVRRATLPREQGSRMKITDVRAHHVRIPYDAGVGSFKQGASAIAAS